jgi:hypothetical protein
MPIEPGMETPSETSAPRVIGRAQTYDEVVDIFRRRQDELGLSNEVAEQLGGLTSGHVDKLLGPTRSKTMGAFTIDVLMEVFAVDFVMVESAEKLARMESRWEEKQRCYSVPITKRRKISAKLIEQAKPLIMRELAKRGAAARNANMSAEQRSKLARRAGRACQRKRRERQAAAA